MKFLAATLVTVLGAVIAAPLCAASPAALATQGHEFDACFTSVGRYYGINPFLLRSVAAKESGFNPRAIHRNDDGSLDVGLMQIDSYWFARLARVGIQPIQLLTQPCLNIAVGAKILKGNIARYGLTWTAVGAYNAQTDWKRKRYADGVAHNLIAELEAAQHASAGD